MIKTMPEGPLKERTVLVERKRAQIRGPGRAPVPRHQEPVRLQEVSYRGLHKNGARLYAQFARVNLVLAKRALL